MDVLRDPVWQFIGIVVSVVIAIVPLLWQRRRLQHPQQNSTVTVHTFAQAKEPAIERHSANFAGDLEAERVIVGDLVIDGQYYQSSQSREHSSDIIGGKVTTKGDFIVGNVHQGASQKKYHH